jgi:hypothetical protein
VFEYKLFSFEGIGRVLPIYFSVLIMFVFSSLKEDLHFLYLWSYMLLNYSLGCLAEKVEAC